jgi:hypothetical protein
MTDTPDTITREEAPERIWATEDVENHGEDRFHSTRPMPGLTAYVREDVADARVAAALREAAEAIKAPKFCTEDQVQHAEALHEARRTLLALIPDAGSAFDRAIAEAVKAEREACARGADEYRDRAEARANVTRGVGKHDATKGHEGQMAAGVSTAAAIRARTEGEG